MLNFFSKHGRPDLAIDLGTANTRIVMAREGIVFDQPSICCFNGNARTGKFLTSGHEALSMRGHTTGEVELVRPLKRGVLVDIDAAHHFLKDAIRVATGSGRTSALNVIVGIPVDATKAERNALRTATMDAGVKSVQLWNEPLAAAVGAGINVALPEGALLVECGAGITEAAIFSLGEIYAYRSLRIGGDSLDQALIDYLKSRFKFRIGEATAERVKCQLFELFAENADQSKKLDIKGLNLLTGLPEIFKIPPESLSPVVEQHVDQIVELVVGLLGDVSPELSNDIHSNGILLTGGGAAMTLIGNALTRATGLSTHVATRQTHCVAEGLMLALHH